MLLGGSLRSKFYKSEGERIERETKGDSEVGEQEGSEGSKESEGSEGKGRKQACERGEGWERGCN
jgi:hypothetical protein